MARWRQDLIPIMVAVLALLLCATLNAYYFAAPYFEQDTVSYHFQANLFAHGRLTAEPPPDRGFSPSVHLNIVNHKWYSLYAFGNAMVLSIGVLAGVPWLIPCLTTGIALFVLYRFLERVYGHSHALTGVVLGLISPATLVMGATSFAEVTDRLFLSVYMLGMAQMDDFSTAAPIMSGLSLGLALNTRPLTAVAFGLAGAAFLAYRLMTAANRARLYRWIAFFSMSSMVGILLYVSWSFVCTGSFTKPFYSADQPYVVLGFGPRAEGHHAGPGKSLLYTPVDGLKRVVFNTAPAVMVNSMGWGYYDPSSGNRLLARNSGSLIAAAQLLTALLTLALVLLPLLHPSRTPWDGFCFAIIAANFICYYFYWFDRSIAGFTPLHTRYYSEATLLGVIPLLARGILIVYGYLKRVWPSYGTLAAGLLFAALFTNTLYSYVRYSGPIRGRAANLLTLRRLVQEQHLHHAVIFTHLSAVPLSDYPFRADLEHADVVYFRLGPSQQWELTFSDWQSAYRRFFPGRQSFSYEEGKLIPLQAN